MVLAGGRGSRLGGVAKGEIRLGGERLIDIVAGAALGSGCERVVTSGNVTSELALSVRENPPFGGPVAGLAAALPEVKTDWIMLLASDLPHARLLCHLLAESFHHMDPELDGLVTLTDFRIQWLAGIYRRDAIEAAFERLDRVEGSSLRSVLGGLKLREVQDPEGLAHDMDTPEDLEAFKASMLQPEERKSIGP